MSEHQTLEQIFEKFRKIMLDRGFSIEPRDDDYVAFVRCKKDRHYTFTLRRLGTLTQPQCIVLSGADLTRNSGSSGTNILYFSINCAEPIGCDSNVLDRFDNMMDAALEYVNYEIPEIKEDIREF